MQNFALPNAQYLVINFFGVFRVTITAKPMKRKDRTAEKAAADPQAVQRGRLRAAAPFGLVFRVVLVAVSRRVLGCGARQRGALVYAKHTPRCQMG